MSEVMIKFADFCEFRQQVIDFMASIAVYSEKRDDRFVRPVAILKCESDYKGLLKMIDDWRIKSEELIELDPIRFSASSDLFNPMPQIITGAESIGITKSQAIRSVKIPKEKIIARMKKYLNHLRIQAENTGSHRDLSRIETELENMMNDTEEFYRLRTHGVTAGNLYMDVTCLVKMRNGLTDKVRVPFAGIALYDPTNTLVVRQPRQQRPRGDSYEFMSVKPIPCSLSSLAGFLYRESELVRARAEYKARKNNI